MLKRFILEIKSKAISNSIFKLLVLLSTDIYINSQIVIFIFNFSTILFFLNILALYMTIFYKLYAVKLNLQN